MHQVGIISQNCFIPNEERAIVYAISDITSSSSVTVLITSLEMLQGG